MIFEQIPQNVNKPCCEQAMKILVDALPDGGKLVELGTFMGRNAILAAEHAKTRGKSITVYCVDIWDNTWYQNSCFKDKPNGDDILNRMMMLAEENDLNIIPLRGNTVTMSHLFEDHSVDMVYVDADHEFGSVTKDIASWLPKLKSGGIMAGHDIQYLPVHLAVTVHFVDGWDSLCGHTWYVKRAQDEVPHG